MTKENFTAPSSLELDRRGILWNANENESEPSLFDTKPFNSLEGKHSYYMRNCERIDELQKRIEKLGTKEPIKKDVLLVEKGCLRLSFDQMKEIWQAEIDYIKESNDKLLKEIGRIRAKFNEYQWGDADKISDTRKRLERRLRDTGKEIMEAIRSVMKGNCVETPQEGETGIQMENGKFCVHNSMPAWEDNGFIAMTQHIIVSTYSDENPEGCAMFAPMGEVIDAAVQRVYPRADMIVRVYSDLGVWHTDRKWEIRAELNE